MVTEPAENSDSASGTNPPRPRVFISYSHTSEQHRTWVRELCERLLANGVDVTLDQWDLREGQDKNAFMEGMVLDSGVSHVLVICDARYQAKANERDGGVGTEGQIISHRVYGSVDQRKFLPIVREYGAAGPCVPVFLASRIYFDFSTDQLEARNFENLLRAIFDKPLFRKPPVGGPPAFVTDQLSTASPSLRPLTTKFRQLAEGGSPAATSSFVDYLECVASRLRELKLTAAPSGREIHEEVFSRLSETIALREEFVATVGWAMGLTNAGTYLPSLRKFFQSILDHQGNPQREGPWINSWDDALAFATYEFYLYYVALLLGSEHLVLAREWLSLRYVERGSDRRRRRYGVFRPELSSLYLWNKRQAPQKFLSPIGHVLRERASSSAVSWEGIIQADLTLWLKSTVDGEDWWPHTSPYTVRGRVLPMYVGIEHDDVCVPVMALLGVKSRLDLRSAVETAWRSRPIVYPGGYPSAEANLTAGLNMEALLGP